MSEYKNVKELTFKEASAELEHIVRALESGELELEDSLAKYARGVELLQELRGRLNSAEQQVQELLNDNEEIEADSTSAPVDSFMQ